VTAHPRTIFGMGGCGFATPEDDLLLDYVLDLSRSDRPRICLLPTAGGDPEEQISRFYAAMIDRDCEPSDLALFRLGRRPVPIREHLLSQDIVYVGGGSLVNLLAIWHAHGVDAILREAWERGVVLAGLSAGCMCWFDVGITTSGGPPAPASGLAMLEGSACVHYHGDEPGRRLRYLEAVAGGLPGGYGIDDHAGLLFRGTRLEQAVSAKPGARAYRVQRTEQGVIETPVACVELRPPRDATPSDIAEFRRVSRGPGRLR
jgi:dipeptidase E